jgi:hypothetical protein
MLDHGKVVQSGRIAGGIGQPRIGGAGFVETPGLEMLRSHDPHDAVARLFSQTGACGVLALHVSSTEINESDRMHA